MRDLQPCNVRRSVVSIDRPVPAERIHEGKPAQKFIHHPRGFVGAKRQIGLDLQSFFTPAVSSLAHLVDCVLLAERIR
jgi:hypothetical protein